MIGHITIVEIDTTWWRFMDLPARNKQRRERKKKKNSNYAVVVPTRGREDLQTGILKDMQRRSIEEIDERDRKSQPERGGSPATKTTGLMPEMYSIAPSIRVYKKKVRGRDHKSIQPIARAKKRINLPQIPFPW